MCFKEVVSVFVLEVSSNNKLNYLCHYLFGLQLCSGAAGQHAVDDCPLLKFGPETICKGMNI
jgi:hypothetical protein